MTNLSMNESLHGYWARAMVRAPWLRAYSMAAMVKRACVRLEANAEARCHVCAACVS